MAEAPVWHEEVSAEEGYPDGYPRQRPGQARPERRLQPNELPDIETTEGILVALSDLWLGTKDPKRRMNIVYPPTAPDSEEFAGLRSTANIVLTELDTRVRKGHISTRQLENLVKVLSVGTLKAFRRASPLSYVEPQMVIPYNADRPEDTGTRSADPVVWGPNRKPILITARRHSTTTPQPPAQNSTGGYIVMPARHKMRCRCTNPIVNNNLDSMLYLQVCLPQDASPEYLVDHLPDAAGAPSAQAVAQNVSMQYFSYVSKAGTVTPKLARRQPLANLARTPAVPWMQPFAEADLLEDRKFLGELMAQVERPELASFAAHLEAQEGTQDRYGQEYRFDSLDRQMLSMDVACHGKRHPMSVDSILSNSVHVAPYHGKLICPFCTDVLEVDGISDAIAHLLLSHRSLQSSIFSCPGCVECCIFSFATYAVHYRDMHQASSAMMVVLDETHVAQRLWWAQALVAITTTREILGEFPPPKKEEAPYKWSALGGYVKKGSIPNPEIVLEQGIYQYQQEGLSKAIKAALRTRDDERRRANEERLLKEEEQRKRNSSSDQESSWSKIAGKKPCKTAFAGRRYGVMTAPSDQPGPSGMQNLPGGSGRPSFAEPPPPQYFTSREEAERALGVGESSYTQPPRRPSQGASSMPAQPLAPATSRRSTPDSGRQMADQPQDEEMAEIEVIGEIHGDGLPATSSRQRKQSKPQQPPPRSSRPPSESSPGREGFQTPPQRPQPHQRSRPPSDSSPAREGFRSPPHRPQQTLPPPPQQTLPPPPQQTLPPPPKKPPQQQQQMLPQQLQPRRSQSSPSRMEREQGENSGSQEATAEAPPAQPAGRQQRASRGPRYRRGRQQPEPDEDPEDGDAFM